MKFKDFLLRTLLSDSDYLVGYDESGRYIRISKGDLAQSLVAQVTPPSLSVQYSTNGSSWHNEYQNGDMYMRMKVGSGEWSGAIRMCVSAYDIWLGQGNAGSEEDFLNSLQGAAGEDADPRTVSMSELQGYEELLQQVSNAMQNAKNEIIDSASQTAAENVMRSFTDMHNEELQEVKSLSDDDYLTIVTSSGLKRVSVGSISNNVAVKTVSTKSLEKAVGTQLQMLKISGVQDGANVVFSVGQPYIAGTSNLYLNGQRLVLGTDYHENGDAANYTMLTYIPTTKDSMVFTAVPK